MSLAILANLTTVGCSTNVYVCTTDSQCGQSGKCVPFLSASYCATFDATCASSWRWDTTAGDSLAGQCIATDGGLLFTTDGSANSSPEMSVSTTDDGMMQLSTDMAGQVAIECVYDDPNSLYDDCIAGP